ncbi:MAG: hypothetical protein IE890_14380 [Arcobacter sp.]|uniref:hypothetical protein n=1 Tax=Arcobacter sp. TaxID=1872629 RepID=UPI0019CABF0A|nr:hypothetical protein [Arcobacter sp.]
MVKKKKYFSFFGILAATVNKKLESLNCMILSVLSKASAITKILLHKQLKPMKLYSTNNI